MAHFVTIEIKNEKVLQLLHSLENLELIRIVHQPSASPVQLSKKFAGRLDQKTAAKMQAYIAKSREEWGD